MTVEFPDVHIAIDKDALHLIVPAKCHENCDDHLTADINLIIMHSKQTHHQGSLTKSLSQHVGAKGVEEKADRPDSKILNGHMTLLAARPGEHPPVIQYAIGYTSADSSDGSGDYIVHPKNGGEQHCDGKVRHIGHLGGK